jgi:NAD(P)-dependent dehydrogenase (short-subunit alcohol dehydrogenase family)
VYGASKAALNRLALQMAVDLGKDGIRVNSVSPGQTPTQLRAFDEPPGTPPREAMSRRVTGESLPLGRRGQLDDYVGPTLFLLSDMSRYVTGIDVPVEGGALAVL